jgi:AAA15 family ATPase/GTPase
MEIQVKKFKKIDETSVNLKPLNIFIGANNSGKSSFIQGIQFAISGCQTLNLAGGVWARNSSKTLSLDSSEFLYIPTKNIEYLYHGKKLTGSRTKQDRAWIEFNFSNGSKSTLKISKGKNGGFTTVLSGKDLGEDLGNIESPYCVYVPGIAGIPTQEKYEVPITIKKSAARGDSNNYLRNILYTISQDKEKWASFQKSVENIYEGVSVNTKFDEHKSEYIYVYVKDNKNDLPLDSVGTGLLQAIQIFAYIEYFNPKIILLDEPDSHIHPTKQRLLANELAKRTENNPDLKIVFSTHSRYILESLESRANVVHFQNGKAFQDVKESKILIDIGAADADFLFSKKDLKYIIITEDVVDNVADKKALIKKFLLANGLTEDEFVLHSYEGCTKVDFARILKGFVRKQIPTANVILHIDRDQKIDSDRDILKLVDDCDKKEILLFVTKYQEIESYFCTPLHIHKIYGVPLDEATEKYKELIKELEKETKRKLKNFILRDRKDLSLNKDDLIDIAITEEIVEKWYEEFSEVLTPGKELLGKTKSYIQNTLKKDPNLILGQSEALIDENFISLIKGKYP